MAVTIVQTKTAASNAGGTTITALFTNPVAAGNMIVCVITSNGTDTMTAPTDSLGNTYNLIYNDRTVAVPVASAWYAYNITGGTNTVTGHLGGANNEISMIVQEYNSSLGAFVANPLDSFTKARGNSVNISSGATSPSGASHGLTIGFGHEGFGSGQTWTVGSGYAGLTSVSTNSGEGVAIESILGSSTASRTATFTLGTSTAWLGGVATFLEPGTIVPRRLVMLGVGK